jgi:hypothetical protein
MSYGAMRILANNFVTQGMITPSSQATGRITGTVKTGTGVAVLAVTGDFAGKFDLTYTLEIDSIAGGTEVGESTFRWKTDNTGAGWEETGVLTRTMPVYALGADGLGSALTVAHTGGVGDDFALADTWKWFARATYGRQRLLDLDRNTYWKSTGIISENLVIDLGLALTPTAIILADHNFTADATVTIEANSSNAWEPPAYTYTFSSITDPLILYLSEEYRYWRIVIADATNTDTYLKIGNLYLGDYTSLVRINASWGSSRGDGYNLQSNVSEVGVMRRYAYSRSRTLNLTFGNTMKTADINTLLDLQEAIVDLTTYRVTPFWLHLFSDTITDLALMEWTNLAEFSREYFRFLLYSGVNMQLSEVVKA